jgi:hypothetical protein
MDVSIQSSRHGNPEPQIAVRMPRGTRQRAIMAELHKLAAEVELATPDREGWCVYLEPLHSVRSPGGRIYLELVDATRAEAELAREVLSRVVAAMTGCARPTATR